MKQVYTPQELADYLRVDKQTVLRYIRQGKIKAFKVNQRLLRIRHEDVEFLFNTNGKGGE